MPFVIGMIVGMILFAIMIRLVQAIPCYKKRVVPCTLPLAINQQHRERAL
jgi:hypothetical protein